MTAPHRTRTAALSTVFSAILACTPTRSAIAEQGPDATPTPISAAPRASTITPVPRNITAGVPWFENPTAGVPSPVDTLEDRFPPPSGFSRVDLPGQSFGAFLRRLPLAAPHSPVLSYRGDVIRGADHPNVAAVVAIDVGTRDLQQCADAVIRLHAEHRYARGFRNHEYRAASGTKLSFARYAAGDRIRVEGNSISLVPGARAAAPTHALFRTWLDDVFGWANTGALSRDGQRIPLADLRPGDFFVLTGVPYGHAVLVLDMAKDRQGRRAILLGQSFVPAQNVHVLKTKGASAWFVVNEAEGSVTTPFWDPFPFDSLRRLPE